MASLLSFEVAEVKVQEYIYSQVLKCEQPRATESFLTPWEGQITNQAGKMIVSHSIHSFLIAEGMVHLAT